MTFIVGNDSKLRHGHARRGAMTTEYVIWQAMKRRCIDPNHKKFRNYGGAGVTVCPKWMGSFEAFLADMGSRPSPKHSLDRYPDRKGNYEPCNVRWATKAQQFANRDIARLIIINGKERPLADVCRDLNADLKVVRNRLNLGWSLADVFSRPIKRRSYKPRKPSL